MDVVGEELTRWLTWVLKAAPPQNTLLYIEWNDARRGRNALTSFHAFGYAITDFDPEDPVSLNALSDCLWEVPTSTDVPRSGSSDDSAISNLIVQTWNTYSTPNGWLWLVQSGGWLELESLRDTFWLPETSGQSGSRSQRRAGRAGSVGAVSW